MNVVQRSMAGGELSPSLYPRTDSAKYGFGLRTLRNSVVRRDGGSRNRSGFEFIDYPQDSTSNIKLIPFSFSGTEGYAIHFEDSFFRVYYRGSPLTVSTTAATNDITGISNASQVVVTLAASGTGVNRSNGDEVYITGVKGMPEINNRIYLVSDITATTFKLKDFDGNYIDSSSWGTYISDGTAKPTSNGTHPFTSAEVPDLSIAQSSNPSFSQTYTNSAPLGSLLICHPDHPVFEIIVTATSYNSVAGSYLAYMINLTPYLYAAASQVNFDINVSAGALTYRYIATAVLDNGEETPPVIRTGDSGTDWQITGISNASQAVVTVNDATGLTDGDLVFITGVRGAKEVNGRYYTISGKSGNTFKINANSSEWGTFEAANTTISERVYLCSVVNSSAAAPTASAPITLGSSGNPFTYPYIKDVHQVVGYNIYKNTTGGYGYVGSTSDSTFKDNGYDEDFTITPPDIVAFHAHDPNWYANELADSADDPLSEVIDNFPSVVGVVQQRACYGNFTDDPEQVICSQTGRQRSFTKLFPSIDSDSFLFQPSSKRREKVRHIVDSGRMVVLTESGEFTLDSESSGPVRPDAFPVQHSSFGSNKATPIVLNGSVIFCTSKGAVIRELFFDISRDGLVGADLSTFSRHLFEGFDIEDMAYQSYPHEIIWCVRSDGSLNALTYVKDQQILAWHRHDFNGSIESICSVPEDGEDAVYVVVNRTIDGSSVKSIERLSSRDYTDIEIDATFMDGFKTFDGRNTDATHTMTLSGGSTWDNTETLTLTSSTSFFVSGDVGNQIFLDIEDADGNRTDRIRFSINAYTSGTVVTGKAHKTVPTGLRSTAIDEWSKAITALYGLDHLEGEDVAVFADGFVVASPNNSKYSTLTVSSGAITLPKPRAVIHVGLPYISDLETLDIDTPSGESLVNRGKLVSCVNLHLNNTRGLWVGPRNPDDDAANTGSDLLYNMTEIKSRNTEDMDSPPALKTGIETINISPEWNSNGRVFIRQVDPVPCEILAIISEGIFEVGE